MGATLDRWTAERIRGLPDDGNRYEAIDGELYVTPAPRLLHQRVVTGIMMALSEYVEQHRIGIVVSAPADIEFADDTLVQPDISVIPLKEGRAPRSWKEVTSLLLAIEVLSPNTADYDRGVKRRLYLRQPVGEYWIVDAERKVIERWRAGSPDALTESATLEWKPPASAPPLVLDIAQLFARATS